MRIPRTWATASRRGDPTAPASRYAQPRVGPADHLLGRGAVRPAAGLRRPCRLRRLADSSRSTRRGSGSPGRWVGRGPRAARSQQSGGEQGGEHPRRGVGEGEGGGHHGPQHADDQGRAKITDRLHQAEDAETVAAQLVGFMMAGVGIGFAETAESTVVALMLPDQLRGHGFGVLGLVQAIGDLGASLVVGVLWAMVSPTLAFTYAAAWMLASLLASGLLRPRGPRTTADPPTGRTRSTPRTP